MAINNPEVAKVFDDLERFKAFCATAYLYGHDGYVFDERNLYNGKSRAWQAYSRFRNGGKRKQHNNNAPRSNNDRYNNNNNNNNNRKRS